MLQEQEQGRTTKAKRGLQNNGGLQHFSGGLQHFSGWLGSVRRCCAPSPLLPLAIHHSTLSKFIIQHSTL